VLGGTITDVVRAAAERFIVAGVAPIEARLDAELLARHALGRWSRSTYLVRAREPFPPERVATFDTLAARRAAREPVAYIVGHAEFWGLEFEITPAVLIPRPETELIVEAVLKLPPVRSRADTATPTDAGRPPVGLEVDRTRGNTHLQIVDVGTGSGCLAVALARELPAARLAATDISAAAIEVARRNARRHGVESRIAFLQSPFCGDAIDCDLIVSNPPYVPERDRASLQTEVRDYEPASALFAGDDGLAVIRELIQVAWHDLAADGGWLVFEFGFGQADAVRALLSDTPAPEGDDLAFRRPWADVQIMNDLQGIPRVAVARKTLRPGAATIRP
jgi:release factor glutamine methyltransferase